MPLISNSQEATNQYYTLTIPQDTIKTIYYRAVNLTSDTQTLSTSYYKSTTSQLGKIDYLPDSSKDALGKWCGFSKEIILNPHEEKIIPITLTIPKDAESGDYLGAFHWDIPNSSQNSFNKFAFLVALKLTVEKNESSSLNVSAPKIDPKNHLLQLPITNTGKELRLQEKMTLTLKKRFQRKERVVNKTFSITPDTTFSFSLDDFPLEKGRYQLETTLDGKKTHYAFEISKKKGNWILTPLVWENQTDMTAVILLFIIFSAGIVTSYWYIRKKRK